MFGRKKEVPNPIWDSIHDKMRYELHHNDDEERPDYTERYEDVPLLPRGTRNNSIPHDLYLQIREDHRIFWYKIDLEQYFAEDIPLLVSRELDLTK